MRPRSATTSWFNKFKLLALVLTTMLSINQVWGEEVVWDFSTDDLSSKSPITLTYGQGSASNNTTIYNSDPKTLRLYPHRSSGNGSWIKFEASTGYEITAVSVTGSSNQSNSRYGVDAENTGAALTSSFSFSSSVATVSSLHATSFAIKNGQNSGSSNKTIALASITITYSTTAPSCAVPTSPTNGTTTKNSQVVSWTDASGSAWDVYYSTSNTAPTTQTTATNLSQKSYTFTGLTPATKYYWWVRTNCGSDNTSSWVAGTAFTTSSITYTDYLTECAEPDVWTVEGDFGEGWKDYDITDGQVVINNLAKNSSYDFKVHKTVGTSHDHYGATADDNKYTTSGANWTLNGAYNVHLKTAASGTYTINVNLTGTHPQISVTYPTAYTITFDGNGNDGGSMTDVTNIAAGEDVVLPANEFTKSCNDFVKWTTNQDGTGTAYTDEHAITVSGNVTLYAQWTPKRYDAIYDANGVTGYTGELPATVTYNCGDQVTIDQSKTLSKFGYTFIGWNTDPAATTPQPIETNPFTIDQGDTYIYAIWNAIKPTGIAITPETGGYNPVKGTGVQMIVTLTPDASTMAEENREVTWSSSNTTYATVNQSGYVNFVGQGTVTITATSKVDGSIVGNYTFYVQAGSCVGWEISAYNSGESNSTMDYFYQVGSSTEWRVKYVLPNGTRKFWVGNCDGWWDPKYGGHSKEWDFGWIRFKDRRDNSCAGDVYPGQDAVGELVIWSNSTDENYGIAFLPNYKISYMTDGSNWRIMDFHSTNTQYSYETDIFQVPVGYKSNSDMKYYVGIEKNDGSNMYVNDGISSTDPMNGVNGLKDADMAGKYGKWHIWSNSCADNWYCEFNRYYQVRFEMNGGDGNIDPMYFYGDNSQSFNTNTLTNPTKTGYNLTGWKDQDNNTYMTSQSITVTKDLVLTAQWEAATYVITFDKNGGIANGRATATYDNNTLTSVTHVSREGYELVGYYTAATGGEMVVTAEGILVANKADYTDEDANWKKASNCTLYAQWSANDYTITYVVPTGFSTSCTNASVHCGTEQTVCTPTAVDGYTFNGWTSNVAIGGKTSFDGGDNFTMPCENVTFTGSYTPIVYNITYEGVEAGEHSNPATYTVETTTIALQNPSARTGYNFTGWTENGNPIIQIVQGTTGNKTITANWEIQSYTVKLNVNGGTINSGNVTGYTYGTGATLPTDVTKTDYKFRGWYSNEGLTEGPVTAIGTTETGNKTFWAKWEETTYSNYRTRCDNYWYVTYNANGKEIAEPLPTDDYGYGDGHTTSVNLSTTELHTTGYTHIGWNTDPDATEALASPHIITGNTTFYAIWTPQVYTISYKDQGDATYSGSNSALLPTSHTYNTATNLVAGVKDGARFEGWYTDAACTGTKVTTLGATEYTGNITLYAKWTAVYAITYTIPGGTLATDAQTSAASGETVTMPGLQGDVPEPYDCEELIGWTTRSTAYEDKTGAMPDHFYAVGETSPVISGATTFYAVYSRPGQGASGTISLTNQEIIDNFKKTTQQGTGAYGILKEYEQDGVGTWSTNGFTEAIDAISLKEYTNPTYYYLKVPQAGGNLTKLSMTYESYSSDRTMYLNSSATTTNAYEVTIPGSSTSMTEVDISSASISNMYILASRTFRIKSVTLSYGAPNIISTGLDCDNTIDEFTITYNANSGQFTDATTTCTGGTFKFSELPDNKYTICSDATCEGMTLVGWNSQANGQGGLNYTPGQEISTVSQDVFTLYAQFAYNVTVKDNKAVQVVHPDERGGAINLNGGNEVCDPIKYDFIGWTTDDPTTWKQTITSPKIFSSDKVTTYTPTAVNTQVTAVYGMSTSVGSQAFYIGYDDAGTPTYLTMSPTKWKKTTDIDAATSIYKETITQAENKYHLYYMDNGVKTYIYYDGSNLSTTNSVSNNDGWIITTSGDITSFELIKASGRYLSYNESGFVTHTTSHQPTRIYSGAKEYKYYDETTCTDEITITFDAGGGTMDPVTTQIVGHEGDVITVPTCSYPGWDFLGWVNTRAAAQSDIKIPDENIYTNEDGHEYEIGSQDETLYAYYTKTPEPPTFDGEISDVWKIYVTTVDGGGNYIYHYEVGAKNISDASAHGEYATTTRCIDATDWAFTNVGTNQFTIQNPKGLYLNGDPNGDENDIYFRATPSVWTMEAKSDGFYKFVNENTPNRYLAFQINNGPTFINTSTANENNSSYSYVKVGGCTDPVYTTSPGGEFKLNMLGNVRVTSTNSKTVRSVDALSISADNLTPNTAITLSADPAVLTFCDATGAALSLTTDANGKLANTAVYVKYAPTAYNTTDMPTITATCGEQHQNFAGLVTGRSLPEKFIIAQKVGDNWYALPNNMTNSQTNPAAVKISAVNEATGTATIYSDVTDHLAYQLQSKGTGTGMAFSSPINNNIIKAHTTAASNTLGLYAQSGWTGDAVKYYEFTSVTSDLVDYTLQNVFQTNYLGITEGNWGIGASNNVRFLAIDQKVAPTLTWKNMMMSEEEQTHATTKAEDGLVVLPGEPNPVACERAIAAGWVFDGWVKQQIDGNRTTDPTDIRVNSGESQTISRSYIALFTNSTHDKWRTSCPTVNTITYKANGGEGADYVQYVEGVTATAVSVTDAGFSKEGSLFVGWNKDGDETGTLIQQGATIGGISGDIIINAVWLGELTISGDVQLTSAVGQKVATATTGITFSSTDMSCATALRITYRNKTNGVDYDRSTYTQSEFRLCNGSYAVADGSNIDMTGVTDDYNQTYSISYTPNGDANTLDHYTMKVEVLYKNTVIATVTKDLYGRTLPEKFAIVARVGDMWYALPNNMASAGTYAPVAVSVDNSDASILNWTATGAKTAGYSMKQMTADYNKLRFAAIAAEESNQYCLWAATSGSTHIRNYSYNSTEDNYRWTVTPKDDSFQAYTLLNENNTKTLRLNGSLSWGMYASGGTDVVYFIPLTDMEVADFQVIEWFANKVLIETNNQTINTSAAKTSVGSGEYAAAMVDGTTYGANQYTLTTGDLTTSAGQSLNIQYQTTASDAWYINSVKVPIIVSQGTKATSTDLLGGLDAQSKYKDNDLVVRDGATLTVDAGTGTWNTFKNVTIYPTSKVVVPAQSSDEKDVTMTTTTMTLFGGIDEIYDGSEYMLTKYGVPQLVLNGKLVHNETTSGLVYDVRLDAAQYYNFALPYTSKYELVTDNKGGEDFTFWTKIYDGETRAAGNNGWVWYDWDADPWAINIGTGYMFAAQPDAGQNYIIIRHPMGYYNAGEDPYAKNEGGHQSGTAEATKAAVDVYAHPSKYDNNAGWNYIANPFMANFTKDQDGEATGTIKTGRLVEHMEGGKWNGHYDWEAESMTVRYVTLYNNGTDTYTQLPMSTAVLAPFTGFFVQIAKDGQIVFDINGRADEAPARMLSDDELPSEMEIFLHAAGQGQTDETVLFLSNGLQRDNAKEFPNEMTKQENAGTLNFYTYGGETKMYANGMSYADGQTWSNAGLKVAKEGNYTFSVTGADNEHVSHVILRDKYFNMEYDLKHTDAEIYLEAGEVNDRFDVKLVLDEHGVTTELDNVRDNNNPEKFIYNDKMFIRVNGRIYDATGKRVNK